MKQILTLLLVCFLQPALASTYYFSTSTGNDSRTSTQAKSSSTPWKTISKLNSFFSSLQPGDQVLFKRGETFYGSITVNKSGTSGSPIVIGAYGTGNKPIITSLVTLSGWTANSTYKGVYECSANSALGAEVNVVLLNDVQKDIGRYPNVNATNKGYLTIESHGSSSITDKELSSYPNWAGAEVVVRPNHWQINKGLIKSHSGNTLYFSSSLYTQDKYGYFIQKSIKTLDQLGEWYYNPSTKKLSMYFGSNSPSSYSVKASAIDILVYASSKSYIKFDNLILKGANQTGFDINSGSNIQLTNSDVLSSGLNGVDVLNHSNFKIENCTVSNSYNTGIATGAGSTDAIIRNNIVKNSYTVAGMGPSGDGKGTGISVGAGSLAEYNQVINSGFLAIRMNGNNVTLKNNLIDNFCYIKDDGGGIYTYNKAGVTYTGRKIIGNIILNGKGAPEGTSTPTTSEYTSAHGIYLDLNVNGIEITGNTIASCDRGIYIHDSKDIIVKNNTVYNNDDQIMLTKDGFGEYQKNHTITNNILFSKLDWQRTLTVNTNNGESDIRNIGRLESNYYARPLNNTKIILTTIYLYKSEQKRVFRDLSNWQSTYNHDYLSKLSSKRFTTDPDANIKFIYNAGQVSKNVSLSGSYVDAKNNRYSTSVTLLPYTSLVLIKDGASRPIIAIVDKANFSKTNVNLFPNPAVNSIHLTFDVSVTNQKAILTIQNISGSTLKRFPVVISGKSLDVNISSLNTGMFTIGLSGDNFNVNRKFIKIN